MKKQNIEVEGGELLIQSKEGHYAVIPAKHRQEVMDMVTEGCDDCINNYIQALPKDSDYAEDGSLIPSWDTVKSTLNPKNWGVNDYTDKGDFDKAYSSARQSGEKEFMWNNKRYSTDYNGTPQQQLKETGITDERLQGSSEIRKRIATNINPQGYGHNKSAIKAMLTNAPEIPIPDDSVKFILPTSAQDKRYRSIAEDSNYFNDEYYLPRDLADKYPRKYHQDALNLTMGYPQQYNSFSVSNNKPSISKDINTIYYKLNSDKTINNILDRALKLDLSSPKQISAEINNSNITEAESSLGTYTVGQGRDDKGLYISYYDINDYSPIGNYIPGKGKGKINSPFGKSFEIYDKIYVKDYGDGKIKRMYYSDKELSELDVNNKNFDTLALQRELSNRGYKLPNSTKYTVNSLFVPDDILIKHSINPNDIGEGGIPVNLNLFELEKANKYNKDMQDKEALKDKNNNYLEYKYGSLENHIKDRTERFKEYGKDIPKEEVESIKKEWDELRINKKLTNEEYLKKYREKHKYLYKDISYSEYFDGILGDETKTALLDYQSQNNKKK